MEDNNIIFIPEQESLLFKVFNEEDKKVWGEKIWEEVTPPLFINKENKTIMESMGNEKELSYGEKAVGIKFNPSELTVVDLIKRGFAVEIDRMDVLRKTSGSPEQKRLCSIALTELQGAQMWAVKAATWKD